MRIKAISFPTLCLSILLKNKEDISKKKLFEMRQLRNMVNLNIYSHRLQITFFIILVSFHYTQAITTVYGIYSHLPTFIIPES